MILRTLNLHLLQHTTGDGNLTNWSRHVREWPAYEIAYGRHSETISLRLTGTMITLTFNGREIHKIDLNHPDSVDIITKLVQEFLDRPF